MTLPNIDTTKIRSSAVSHSEKLSKEFIAKLSVMTEDFNRLMTRSEYSRFMEAMKLGDFHWTDLTIRELVTRMRIENEEALGSVIALKEQWDALINANGGTDAVIRSSYAMSREGLWPWWSKSKRTRAKI